MHENPTVEEEDFELEAVQGLYPEGVLDAQVEEPEDDGVFWTAPGECPPPSTLDAALGAFTQSVSSLAASALGEKDRRCN